MSDSSPPRVGERFAGTYKLTALLRGAGAAQVFAAVDAGGREVALVTVDPARCDPNDWASFAGFIAAATAANIPGVSLLQGVGPTPPSPPHCLAEVPAGRAFDRLREGGPVPWQRALALGEQVAAILEAVDTALGAHHGALTAARCVLAGDADVKVLDFGLALLEPHGRADDGYRAPEQQLGPGDHRSDIYSLAAILFELIAGTRPSPKLPPRLRSLVPDAPPAVDELLAKALARAPEQRHPELARFRAALRELLGLGPVPTRPAPAPTAPRPAVAAAEPPAPAASPAPPELPSAANPASPPPPERPRPATPPPSERPRASTPPEPERPRPATSPRPEPARASTPTPTPTRPPVAAARPKTPPRGAEPRIAPSSPAAAERPRPAPRPAPSTLAPLPALDQLRPLAGAADDDPDAALPTMAFGDHTEALPTMAFAGDRDALPTMAFAGSVGKATADRTVILPGASPPPATADRTVILPGGPAAQARPATPDRTVILPGAAPARPFPGLADVPVDRTVRFPQSGETASARPWAPSAGTTVDRAVRQSGVTIDRAVRLGAPAPADRTVVLRGPDADDEPPEGATVVDPRRRAPPRDDQTLIVPRGAPNDQETMILDVGAPPGTARPPAPVQAPRWPLKKTLIVVNVVAALLLVIVLLSR